MHKRVTFYGDSASYFDKRLSNVPLMLEDVHTQQLSEVQNSYL